MLCQHCQKRVANVHFTQIVNNKKIEMYLCEQCANEKGQFSFVSPFNMNNFFSGFMGANNSMPCVPSISKEAVCSKCGMSYDEFQKAGKLGCSNCYEAYGDRLKPILKRLHGNMEHSGKIPVRISKVLKTSKEIEELKELLSKFVQNEEYEKAAEIRDRIKAIENGELRMEN